MLASIPDSAEIAWVTALLVQHAGELATFVTIRDQLDNALLSGDFDACEALLNDIEVQLGASLWAISRRIYTLQARSGLDAQKVYSETIRTACRDNSVAAFITFYDSVRAEPTVTPDRLRAQLDAHLDSFECPPALRAYIRLHIHGALPPHASIGEVLRIEQIGSCIDLYGTFGAILRMLVAGDSPLSSGAEHAAVTLADHIADEQSASLSAFVRGDPQRPYPRAERLAAAVESQLAGDYAAAARAATTLFSEAPSDPDTLLLVARALALAPLTDMPQCLGTRTATRLATLLSAGQSAVDDLSELTKLAFLLRFSPLGPAIATITNDASSSVWPVTTASYIASGCVLTAAPNPFWIDLQPSCRIREYTALTVFERFGETPLGMRGGVFSEEADRSTALPIIYAEPERDLVAAQRGVALSYLPDAEPAAHRLTTSSIPYFRRRGYRLLPLCQLASDAPASAVHTVTSFCIAEPGWHDILPIAATADAIRTGHASLDPGDISVPILFDLYAQHVDPSHDRERVDSFTDFLEAHRLARPSQLPRIASQFAREKVVYVLRYVAVESVMDRTTLFNSSRAVVEERLSICRALLDLDAANSVVYHEEIKALARRLMLARRMRELDQSKIYVDIDNLRRKVDPELRELYARYIALRRERPSPIPVATLSHALRKAGQGDYNELAKISLPKSEVTDIFETIIKKTRDEYTSSPEHGLDKYLSVRIRHGTLAGYLRRPVDASHLVTPRDAVTDSYKPNEYWPSHLMTSLETDALLSGRLATFSAEFDALLDEVKSWLHVSTDEESAGLFHFALSESSMKLLAEYLGTDLPFDTFMERVVEAFDVILDERLAAIRQQLDQTAKHRAAELLHTLARDVEDFAEPSTGPLLNAIRSANTELQLTFDRVGSWFYRSRSAGSEPFALEEAIDVGVESARTIAPDFVHTLELAFELPIKIHGSFLTPFVDLLFIVFENIIRHSGRVDKPTARIRGYLHERVLTLEITNPVAAGVAATARESLENLKAQVLDRRHVVFVRREGGSGFHKLARILKDDFQIDPHLDFGFVGDDEFFVTFELPVIGAQ